jgi:hypothetical protein
MDDVVWDDDEDIRILIGSQAKNQKTRLQSIKGAAPALLMVPVLKKSFSTFRDGDDDGSAGGSNNDGGDSDGNNDDGNDSSHS